MSDFKQLALQFVLTDEPENQRQIAHQTAQLIETSPSNSLPVAKWVESIRPWMPGNEDTDVGDGGSTGDVIARAKALQFLAATLAVLDKDMLIAAHIKLLITFFGAMFNVDHKAGILPSAKSLTTICSMKAFPPSHGYDIISNVCAMGEDFPKQVAETRLAIFDLFYRLVNDEKVGNDLRRRHEDCDFMIRMLDLFKNERDPKNLISWFSVIETLLAKYSPPSDVAEKLFNAYSAYFPISLRTSKHPSGITADDLKLSLRRCFAANDVVSSHTIPFLIQKLNQGDGGITVNVKLDILGTLKECILRYQDAQNSVVPYVDKIWNCLKYEVRNGEVNDTINATLETIRAMTGKLEGDSLRNFTLTVLRECLDDLSNPTYAAQAGKLLVCTASATPGAFVLVIAPAAKQVMEDLRHTKSRDHKRDLLALLNSILEVRSLFIRAEASFSREELGAMEATDSILHSLYEGAYKPSLQSPPVVAKKAVEGLGLLATQTSAAAGVKLLLSDGVCSSITESLIERLVTADDELVDETVVALQRVVMAWPPALDTVLDRTLGRLGAPGSAEPTIEDPMTLTSRLAYIVCSEVPKGSTPPLSFFIRLTARLLSNLDALLKKGTDTPPSQIWAVYPAALQAAMRYFKDALVAGLGSGALPQDFPESVNSESWRDYISAKYPTLGSFDRRSEAGQEKPAETHSLAGSEVFNDYLLICLHITRELYRRSVAVSAEGLTLREEIAITTATPSERRWRDQYVHLISSLATFTISQLSQIQQCCLKLHEDVVTLFRGDDPVGGESTYRDLALKTVHPLSVYEEKDLEVRLPPNTLAKPFLFSLALGVLQPLHTKAVEPLFESGFGQEFLASQLLASRDRLDDPHREIFLMVLGNKYKVEGIPKVLHLAQHQLDRIVANENVLGLDGEETPDASLSLARSIYALIAGIVRRSTGAALAPLLASLLKGPSQRSIGTDLASKYDAIFRPHECLAKEYNAVIKPLWAQKAYIQIAKPMIPLAWPRKDGSEVDNLTRRNYSIAVVACVKHLDYSIYQDDAADLVRLVLCVLRSLPVCADVEAALRILETVTKESTGVMEPFLKSVVGACVAIVRGEDPSPVLEGEAVAKGSKVVAARCRNLAVGLLGILPVKYEHRHLRSSAPGVRRLLSVACGDAVRGVRRAALTARLAWADVN